jgi:hypothetical protein
VPTADRREILSRVAAGTITPEEAAAELDSIGQREARGEAGLRQVRITRQLGMVEVIGDPTVHEAVANGPHSARIDGDVMVIQGDSGVELGGGFFFGIGPHTGSEKLTVRLNPSLTVELHIQAANGRVRGVEGPIHVDLQAGSVTVDGFRSPLTASVQAGSLSAYGRLDSGESRITCNAGSVNVSLERGSSVSISARSALGKVELPGSIGVSGRRPHEVMVGDGAGRLVIDSNMGSVKVTTDW